jgi:dipeptidyl aminopeptidase/acylaminoacyl peptidase
MWPVTWSDDFARMIVYAEGDNDAGTYWLIDGKSAGPLGYAYPDLPDAVVGKVSVVTYRAADGLEIHAILTLPPGREARALPLVVLPHGGPQAHDTVSFDWWAQAYASRGYAVLQPNFRGSTGYGRDFRDAGFGQWGRKMQTDLSDGVAALAAQGVIDRRRVCIVGASYGGYAALAGVTVQHGLYRCAVSVAGVSDLAYLISNNLWENGQQEGTAGVRYLNRFLSVTSQDDRGLNEISPVRLAARADAPILLIHGLDDTVVPVRQSRDMEAALARAGKPVEFLQLPGEDHWLSSETTRKAMLQAAVRFVERYNPPE